MSTKPLNLILMGPQGAGKGTQANKLTEKYHFYSLETGKLLRQLAIQPTALGHKVKQFLDKGILVDLQTYQQAVESELNKIPDQQGIILDGLPRSLAQAEILDHLLAQHHRQVNGLIYLKLDEQTSIQRLSQRRICAACGKVYNLTLQPDLQQCGCGGKLIQRSDDTPAAIRRRLTIFQEETLPIIQRYQDKVIEIDASQSIDQVFTQVCQAVDKIIASQQPA